MTYWPKEELLASRANAVRLAQRAVDEKAADPIVLDVSGSSDMFTHLVIMSASSSRHARALADSLRALAKELGMYLLGAEGLGEGRWVLLDMTDVVVHIFLPEVREFYNLEVLWADASRVPLKAGEREASPGSAKEPPAVKRRGRKTGSMPADGS